jgi:hypothetical protein
LKDKKQELEIINNQVKGYFENQSSYGLHVNDPKPSIFKAIDIPLPKSQ